MAEYRCNNTEQYKTRLEAVEQGKSRLQNNRPLVLVQDALPGWSKEKTTDAYLQGVGRWSKVADIKWAVITDLAEAGPKDVVNLITVADLGDDGVLADQVLPNGSTRILPMRMNSRIRWILTDGPMNNGVDAARVFLHEGGHFIDHQHWPRGKPDEVMEPYISDNIWTPQPTEAAVTAQWFGIPGQTPDPAPTPTPTPKGNCCFRFKQDVLTARIPMALTPEQEKALAALDCQALLKGLFDKFLAGLISSVCPAAAQQAIEVKPEAPN